MSLTAVIGKTWKKKFFFAIFTPTLIHLKELVIKLIERSFLNVEIVRRPDGMTIYQWVTSAYDDLRG